MKTGQFGDFCVGGQSCSPEPPTGLGMYQELKSKAS